MIFNCVNFWKSGSSSLVLIVLDFTVEIAILHENKWANASLCPSRA